MERFFIDAKKSFTLGKLANCRALLNEAFANEDGKSSVARWLVESNLIVCSYKEHLTTGKHVDVSEFLSKSQHLLEMIHGLPPSLTALPIELTVSFNTSALLLQQMNQREPVRSGLIRPHPVTELVSTSSDQIQKIISTCLQRVCCALGVSLPRQVRLEKVLTTVASISHLLPACVSMLVSLHLCVLGVCHMITRNHQEALDILGKALEMNENRRDEERSKVSSLALMVNLQVCHVFIDPNGLDNKSSLSFHVGDLSRFLLVACFFRMGQWEDCLHHITCQQPKLPECLIVIQQFFQGFSFYQKGDFKSALDALKSLPGNRDLVVTLRVKALNLIGCCFASLNKPHTAIQKYQEALKTDFSYLCPLYNVSLVYRRLNLQDAEIEAMEILTNALREQHSSTNQSKTEYEILESTTVSSLRDNNSYSLDERQLTATFAMYTLARSCCELSRYGDGAKRYKELLHFIENDLALLSELLASKRVSSIPPLRTVYLEAAQSLYDINNFEDSLSLCNKVLSKIRPRTENLSGNGKRGFSQDVLPEVDNQSHQFTDSQFTVYKAFPSGTSTHQPCSSGSSSTAMDLDLSYKPSFLRTLIFSDQAGETKDAPKSFPKLLVVGTLLLKSNCLIMMNDLSEAEDTIDDLLKNMSGITRIDVSSEAGETSEETPFEPENVGDSSVPRSKRRKTDSSSLVCDDVIIEKTSSESIRNQLLEAKAKAYNNKSVILIGRWKNNSEGLRMLLLGMQCKPDDVDVLYNYALQFAKMGRKKEARETMKQLEAMDTSLKTSALAKYLL